MTSPARSFHNRVAAIPRPFMHSRVVIFDLWDTLLTLNDPSVPGRSVAEMLGVDRAAWHRALFASDDFALGRGDGFAVFSGMIRSLRADPPEGLLRRAYDERNRRFGWALTHVPNRILAALGRLREAGYRLGLLSNVGTDEIAAWPRSPLRGCFDAAVFSCEVHLKKPDPAIFRLAAERLGVTPTRCCFVGDGTSHEHRGAREAGMTTILLTEHLRGEPAKIMERRGEADEVAKTLADVVRDLVAATE
ncbi:MAG: HAD family hydrolase [Planctomycetota bacterium]